MVEAEALVKAQREKAAREAAEYNAWLCEAEEALDKKTFLTDEDIEKMQAQSDMWLAAARRELEAHGEAEAYDAWVVQKVQEALDSSQFWTHEEMEAETEAWCAETLREMAAEGRRVAGEVEMGRRSEG